MAAVRRGCAGAGPGGTVLQGEMRREDQRSERTWLHFQGLETWVGVPVSDEGDVVFRPFSPHLLHVILSLRRYQWTIRPMGTPGQQALPHLDSAPTASSPVT